MIRSSGHEVYQELQTKEFLLCFARLVKLHSRRGCSRPSTRTLSPGHTTRRPCSYMGSTLSHSCHTPTWKRARTVEVSDSDNETQSKTPNTGADARHRSRDRGTPFSASAISDEQALTQMLAWIKTDPSVHHQKWLGRSALFIPDGEHEQLMVTVGNSRVQGMKASFQLASADDQVWWVDTTTAACAIMHRILFDKDAQANGMAPGTTAMDLIGGKGAGAGAKAAHTDIPDIRKKLKAHAS